MTTLKRLGQPFERSDLFRELCAKAFQQCDMDNSGRIDVKELHIGLLILYDKINSVLPIHYPVPTKREVGQLMKRFDTNRSAELDFQEFYSLAKFQMGIGTHEWHRSIWFRILRRWAFKAVVWPAAGLGAKTGLRKVGLPVRHLPTAVAAYAIEAGVKACIALR